MKGNGSFSPRDFDLQKTFFSFDVFMRFYGKKLVFKTKKMVFLSIVVNQNFSSSSAESKLGRRNEREKL